jgi:hypothetical protein
MREAGARNMGGEEGRKTDFLKNEQPRPTVLIVLASYYIGEF